ncbi:glycoside hydrolase family 2 TIM barrel-domain containing protein [Ferruginibacter profundus]
MKKIGIQAIIFCSLLLIQAAAPAQKTIRLINNWQYLRQDVGSIYEVVRPAEKGAPETLPLWESVSLPHCVNATDAVDPDINYYQGAAWYRTQLDIQNPYTNGRTLLHFEGAGQKTKVYVYDQLVGEHVGGYDEWRVDITDAILAFKKTAIFQKQFGNKIPVAIRTDNSRDVEMIPSNLSDFNLYGGIYRYLNLVYTPAVSVEKLFALAEVDKEGKYATLHVTAGLYHPAVADNAIIKVDLIDPAGKIIQQAEKKISDLQGTIDVCNFKIRSPQLWSVEKPTLYTVTLTLSSAGGTCTQTEHIGFRNFEFLKQGPFLLNGKRVLLQGTHRHEDHAGVGAAMTEEMMRTEMLLMKDMGVNFIRLGHYQQSRIILQLCDSLGILVWEEIPWCRGGLGGDVYKAQAKRMLTNMIEQHYNHPAIIVWGLGNENDWPGDFPEFDKEKIRAFMTVLNQQAHQLDSTRKTAIRRCDFCKDIVDVYSPSIWAGWYRGIYTDYKEVSKTEFDKVDRFLHVEWGGDSHAGRHSENPDNALRNIKGGRSADERAGDASLIGGAARVSKDGDWSESYICNLMDWHLKEQETMPWLSGTAQWAFKDFSTPIRPDNPVPYVNQKGVVTRDGTPKEAFYVFQSYWAAKPMAHIYGHTWPVRWGNVGEEKMIKVYSNCDEAELFVNGKSVGIKKRNSQDFPAAGLRWPVVLLKGMNQVKVIAKKGKMVVEDAISFQYQTEKWDKPAKLVLEKLSEANGIAVLQVKLFDNKNVQCLDAANWVRFNLTGDGKLIDNMGTPDAARYVQLYNGRALIKIQTAGGKNVVSVQSAGLPTAFINCNE